MAHYRHSSFLSCYQSEVGGPRYRKQQLVAYIQGNTMSGVCQFLYFKVISFNPEAYADCA